MSKKCALAQINDAKPLAVVTGGAGFLGGHLCARLVRDGYRVLAIDDLSTGSSANVAALNATDFVLLQHDITQVVSLPDLFKISCIFNLACPASPVQYQHMPLQTMKTNLFGALNMLELAHKMGANILQASTSEVYGSAQVVPQPESYWGHVNPCGIRSCYDEGKRAAEAVFFDHHRIYGTKIKVVRIFNTYGPGMAVDDGRVVSNFVRQALQGEPMTVFGDGSQTRSLCYVDDLIDGLMVMMHSHERVLGPINLGNPEEISVLALAELIRKLTHSTSEIVFRPLPQDDPVRRVPDIHQAKNLLGWEPTVTLREGLERTIAHMAKQLADSLPQSLRRDDGSRAMPW